MAAFLDAAASGRLWMDQASKATLDELEGPLADNSRTATEQQTLKVETWMLLLFLLVKR